MWKDSINDKYTFLSEHSYFYFLMAYILITNCTSNHKVQEKSMRTLEARTVQQINCNFKSIISHQR